MEKLTKETKHKPQDVIKRAVAYFGPKGLGLMLKSEDNYNAFFEGEGVSVRVTATAEPKGTTVEVEATELDHQTKEFLGKI